jgi:hypothetical protein
MLKGNLATRPFYNEQPVNLLIAALAIGAILLAAFNTTRAIYLSGERARRTVVERDAEEEIRTLTEAAAKQRATVDPSAMGRLGITTAEANDLIEQRIFSWTVLLGLLEQTIPMDVRLISIGKRFDNRGFTVSMNANAKRSSDLEQFIERLWATGYFYDVFSGDLQGNDDNTFTSLIEGRYQAPSSAAQKTEAVREGGNPR